MTASVLRPTLKHLSLAILAACATPVWAAGFDVPVIATAMQGTSNANHAEANDASVLYYNPAGITRLKGLNVSNSLSIITLSGKVENLGTTGTPSPEQTGPGEEGPLIEGGGAGTYWPKVLGSAALFASMPWNDEITLGFGIFPAAGGNLNNKADWFGRNFADATAVEIIDANSVGAIRFDDKHSLGFGTNLLIGHLNQKLQIDIPGVAPYLLQPVVSDVSADSLTPWLAPAEISQLTQLLGVNPADIKLGILYDQLPPELKGQLAKLAGQALLTPESRGSGTIEMYGYGLGWNIGYMFSPVDETRFGISFRSKVRMKMRGDIDWEVSRVEGNTDSTIGLPAPDGERVSGSELLSEYYRPDATTKSTLIIPAKLSFGLFHKLNDKIDLMSDLTLNKTSDVKEIKVYILDEKEPNRDVAIKQEPGVINTKWRDSFKLSVGGNYHYDDKLTLRGGYMYDMTPIRSARYRHPSAPDSNRHMLSVGANYKLKKNMHVDAAYSLVHLEDTESHYRDPCRGDHLENDDGSFDGSGPANCTGNGGTFHGRFTDTFIHILGLQLNSRF
ncbi:MAG: outer membrane protein transport protein [Pseudomonadota bacterium]